MGPHICPRPKPRLERNNREEVDGVWGNLEHGGSCGHSLLECPFFCRKKIDKMVAKIGLNKQFIVLIHKIVEKYLTNLIYIIY